MTYRPGGENGLQRGQHRGRGPRGYRCPDECIREEVIERLTRHCCRGASEIDVLVEDSEMTPRATTFDGGLKRLVEEVADSVPGVSDVHNHLRPGPLLDPTLLAGESVS